MTNKDGQVATGEDTRAVSITLPNEVYASFAIVADYAGHPVARELREQLVAIWRKPEFGALLRRANRQDLAKILSQYDLTSEQIEEIIQKAYSERS